MAASHHKLDNLTAIVDRNGLQIDGKTEDVMKIEPLPEKWRSFGWHVSECNGHDFGSITEALQVAGETRDKPSVVIAHTVMGKGIAAIENDHRWHGKVPGPEQAAAFIKEIG